MKKIKLLMSMLLLIGVAMLMWKCQTNDDDSIFLDNQIEQSKRIVNKITWKDLPFNLQKDINRIDELARKNNRSQEELLFINQDQIIAVTDSLSNTKYSIKFKLPNQPDNVLYNLVLGHDVNDREIDPFIIKYSISNIDEVYTDLEADFTKMKGRITTHSHTSLLDYIDSFDENNRTTNTLEEEDCPGYSTDDSSGSSSDGNTGSSGSGGTSGSGNSGTGNTGTGNTNEGPTFPTFEEDNGGSCTVNVWTNGTTGEGVGITWSCTDGSSGSAWNDRNNDNCLGDGDVAINDEDLVVDSPDDPIEDIAEYLACFDASSGAEITIYIDQPVANSDRPWTLGSGKAGHSFIGIRQGGVIRYWGLYPEGNAGPLGPDDPYVFGNNQNNEFDVSISWSISGSELSYIIANAHTYTSDYDLNDNNCTDYVISVALLTGVVLPDPQSSWPGGAGSNPGAFGQAIRNMTLLPGMSRNGDGGTSSFNSVNCN